MLPPMRRLLAPLTLTLLVTTWSTTTHAEDIACARCREICRTSAYPDNDTPDMRSGRLVHRSPEAKRSFEEGVAADPGLGGKSARVAVEAYKRAVMQDPDNAPYRNHLAAALLTTSQYQEAIYNLEKAASLVPAEPKYIVNLGYAWHRAGDEQRALVHYMRALILDPRDLRARLFTGYALEILGMGSEATREFRRVLLDDPGNPGAKAGLARLGHQPAPIGAPPPAFTAPPSPSSSSPSSSSSSSSSASVPPAPLEPAPGNPRP
jgi:tetratricopeptide (TPR) repeat protein